MNFIVVSFVDCKMGDDLVFRSCDGSFDWIVLWCCDEGVASVVRSSLGSICHVICSCCVQEIVQLLRKLIACCFAAKRIFLPKFLFGGSSKKSAL